MTVLPIVERELRVAARRRRTYRNRLLAAVAAVGPGAWILCLLGGQNAQVGRVMFVFLGVLIFCYAVLAGALLVMMTCALKIAKVLDDADGVRLQSMNFAPLTL